MGCPDRLAWRHGALRPWPLEPRQSPPRRPPMQLHSPMRVRRSDSRAERGRRGPRALHRRLPNAQRNSESAQGHRSLGDGSALREMPHGHGHKQRTQQPANERNSDT
eukprot:8203161-Lingulodinium_polyedra.AAC.4